MASSVLAFMALYAGFGLLPERIEVHKFRYSNLDTTNSGDDSLTYALGVRITFTLEVILSEGSVVHIERTTPNLMNLVNS